MARFNLSPQASVQALGERILLAGIDYKATGTPNKAVEAEIVGMLSPPAETKVYFHYDDDHNLHVVVPNTNQIGQADLKNADPGADRLKRIAAEGLGAAVILGCEM